MRPRIQFVSDIERNLWVNALQDGLRRLKLGVSGERAREYADRMVEEYRRLRIAQ